MLAFLHTKIAISFNILSVQMICLSANMYRQISRLYRQKLRKGIIGGGGGPPPHPPPSGYASDYDYFYKEGGGRYKIYTPLFKENIMLKSISC